MLNILKTRDMTDPIHISNSILIDAKVLRNTNEQERQINEHVFEILKKINEDIKDAHQDGQDHIIAGIPTVFSITNMSNMRAQRNVWAKIIEILVRKHYNVKISYGVNYCSIKIGWEDKDASIIAKYQTDLINSARNNEF